MDGGKKRERRVEQRGRGGRRKCLAGDAAVYAGNRQNVFMRVTSSFASD